MQHLAKLNQEDPEALSLAAPPVASSSYLSLVYDVGASLLAMLPNVLESAPGQANEAFQVGVLDQTHRVSVQRQSHELLMTENKRGFVSTLLLASVVRVQGVGPGYGTHHEPSVCVVFRDAPQ